MQRLALSTVRARNTLFANQAFRFSGDAAAAKAEPAKKFGPKLDENDEPRFLEQVKLFFNEAAGKTGIDEEYLNLIKAC